MFKNFHSSLNSLEYQYSVHNSLLHLLSNFQEAITAQNIAYKKLSYRRETARQLHTSFSAHSLIIQWAPHLFYNYIID